MRQKQEEQPVQHMLKIFVYAIFLIIATVSIFNFIIYQGKLPSILAIGERGIAEPCDTDSDCFEPLRCTANTCTLFFTEKGATCNNQEFKCAQPLICQNNLCKQKARIGQECDEKSMQTCENSTCFDGICRQIYEN